MGVVEKAGNIPLVPVTDSKTGEVLEEVPPTAELLAKAMGQCVCPRTVEVAAGDNWVTRVIKYFGFPAVKNEVICPPVEVVIGKLTPENIIEVFDPQAAVTRLPLEFPSEGQNA